MIEQEKYKKSVLLWDFQRYNNDNKYFDLIESWRNNEIKKLGNYADKFQDILKEYLLLLEDMAINVFQLFSALFRTEKDKLATNTFNSRFSRIEAGLAEIPKYVKIVSENLKLKQFEDASFLQGILHILLCDFLTLLQSLGINIAKSPLKKDFKAAEKEIWKPRIPKKDEFFATNSVKRNKDKKKPLEDFFTDEVSPELITAIQEKFNHLRGKEMAILIYLLHKKYSLIYLDNNNRKANSRIHFFRALTSTNLKRTVINNFFEPITGETTVNEKDEVFVKIDNQLKEMVSNG